MMQEKQKILTFVLIGLSMILALVGAFFGVKLPYPEPPVITESRAIVGSLSGDIAVEDNLTVGGNATVAGTLDVAGATSFGASQVFEGATADAYETTLAVIDPTADRTATLPNASGYVMVSGGTGKYVLGTNTITGTLTVSHGLTTPEAVFCSLVQDAEANAATCSATISGSTVVVKTWKADGATAGSVGKLVSWLVAGQP